LTDVNVAIATSRVCNTSFQILSDCNIRFMTAAARIEAHRGVLTPSERRVADVVLGRPDKVAFGTVAGVAGEAGVSAATVVRFAARLGYEGFVPLQADVRDELGGRLRPAVERIRQAPPSDLLGRSLATELDNVHRTLEAVDRRDFAAAVQRLADRTHGVVVVAAEASRGVGVLLTDGLDMLRPGVQPVQGSAARVARALASVEPGDTVVALDLRRYERWVLDAVRYCATGGASIVALTDSALSPLADLADETFVVAAEGSGPFDSHVGMLAVANALVAGVAARLRRTASRRLDRVEAAWRDAGALVER
jgi:DNA-binding MurR/RpiR family transcriptional regulator